MPDSYNSTEVLVATSVYLEKPLRAQLEKARNLSRRSLSQEIAFRLAQSLASQATVA